MKWWYRRHFGWKLNGLRYYWQPSPFGHYEWRENEEGHVINEDGE